MDKKVSEIANETEVKILGFYVFDYESKYYVRELSRVLNWPHRTVSLALQRLKKKGILQEEDVGKTMQYFLNMEDINTKQYLCLAEYRRTIVFLEKYFLIKKLMGELSLMLKECCLIVFGSYAKGEETSASDIDLVIVSEGSHPHLMEKIHDFEIRHNKKIQVQRATKEQFETGFREKDHLMVEIVKNHVILNNGDFFVDMLWRCSHER